MEAHKECLKLIRISSERVEDWKKFKCRRGYGLGRGRGGGVKGGDDGEGEGRGDGKGKRRRVGTWYVDKTMPPCSAYR